MFEYNSIEQYHAQLKNGVTSCKQAAEHYLQQIAAHQHLNAFVTVFTEEVKQQAQQLDAQRKAGRPMGKLHGVFIGIKDVISYQHHSLTAASKILQNFSAVYSATAVERLIEEEAIIIGSLNCDEFGMGSTNENSVYGRVKHAADESRVSGGSSGGSAVAIQTGCCMLALGSDTGGSVRQPADFCGVIGFKPSYGRISRYGLIAYASSFDQIGILGTDIADIALLLEVMAGADKYDSTASQKPLPAFTPAKSSTQKFRFAYFEEALSHPGLDPEIASAIKNKCQQLKAEGHEVQAVSFDLLDYVVPAYYVLTTAEASSNLARYDGVRYGYRSPIPENDLSDLYINSRSEGFGKEVKRRIMLGSFVLSAGYYDAYYTKAQKVRKLLKDNIRLIFNEFDFILLPTSPVTAFKAGEKMKDPIAMYLADIYTVLANLTGIPAISLPIFKHSNQLPFGLQVMSDKFNEVPLLEISKKLLAEQL